MCTYDVTVDRNKYIGGSDIPIIMGISKFKNRFTLLLEKAGLKENEFLGYKYTEHGSLMEPLIRDYINQTEKNKFIPNRIIKDDLRVHTDGFNGECVLEIKDTSNESKTLSEYTHYIVQLLFGMHMNNVAKGKLAVYHREDNMNCEFIPEHLTVFDINYSDYIELDNEIHESIVRFRSDLQRIKQNPLLTEEDFQPKEIVSLASSVLKLESKLEEYKSIDAEYKDLKQKLFDAMKKYDIKSWRTFDGTKITRVNPIPATNETVQEFDLEKFKIENPNQYKMYLHDVQKKKSGKKGFIKITVAK